MYTIKLMYLSCGDSARTVSMLFFESVRIVQIWQEKANRVDGWVEEKKIAKDMSRSSKLDPLAIYFSPV